MKYKELADHSRVWIYQSDRRLSEQEVSEISKHGEQFISEWAAHGMKLMAAFEVFYNRFLVLFVDEEQARASGCSIDSSVHFMKKIGQVYNIDLFDRMSITYKEEGEVKALQMNAFQEALNTENLTENTIVFNNLVKTKAEFDTAWEVPLKQSWHQQMLVG